MLFECEVKKKKKLRDGSDVCSLCDRVADSIINIQKIENAEFERENNGIIKYFLGSWGS